MYEQSRGSKADGDAEAGVDENEQMLEHNLQQFAAYHGIEMASLAEFCRLTKAGFRVLKTDRFAR